LSELLSIISPVVFVLLFTAVAHLAGSVRRSRESSDLERRLCAHGWGVRGENRRLTATLDGRTLKVVRVNGLVPVMDRVVLYLMMRPEQNPGGVRFEMAADHVLETLLTTDTQIGHARVDALLVFSFSDESWFGPVMRRRVVQELLDRCLEGSATIKLSERWLRMELSGRLRAVEVMQRLALLEELQRQLSQSASGDIDRTEASHETSTGLLALQVRVQRGGPVRFTDMIRGYRVQLSDEEDSLASSAAHGVWTKNREGGSFCRMQISLKGAMPAGLRVMSAKDGLVGMVDIYTPILREAVAVFGRPPDRVRNLLSHEAVLPGLLALFLERDDALIHESRIEATLALTPLGSADLLSQVHDLIDLAEALDGAVQMV
jgi:hypothetical protein